MSYFEEKPGFTIILHIKVLPPSDERNAQILFVNSEPKCARKKYCARSLALARPPNEMVSKHQHMPDNLGWQITFEKLQSKSEVEKHGTSGENYFLTCEKSGKR